jgi:hypothetical protein
MKTIKVEKANGAYYAHFLINGQNGIKINN